MAVLRQHHVNWHPAVPWKRLGFFVCLWGCNSPLESNMWYLRLSFQKQVLTLLEFLSRVRVAHKKEKTQKSHWILLWRPQATRPELNTNKLPDYVMTMVVYKNSSETQVEKAASTVTRMDFSTLFVALSTVHTDKLTLCLAFKKELQLFFTFWHVSICSIWWTLLSILWIHWSSIFQLCWENIRAEIHWS